jgi:tRNA(Ile)-lysidine synthase
MANLRQSMREFIEREQLFTASDKLLLACSGGLDSTVLAHLLHAEGYDFAIAHMNFQLRGEASNGDAAFVEELARTLGAKFYCKAVDVKAQAKPGESTQMTARRLRYEWFDSILDQGPRNRLVTAHHAEDNLETSLINLIRGTGLTGLAGMNPKRRPLLQCTREQLQEFASVNSIHWREDESNASDNYLRNRVRHHLTPLLKDLGLTTNNWVKTATHLRSALALYKSHLSHISERYTALHGDVWIVDRHEDLPQSTLSTYLHESIQTEHGFTSEQIRQMLSVAGCRIIESPTHAVFVEPERLSFISKKDIDAAPIPNRKVISYPNTFETGYIHFHVTLVPRPANLNEPKVQHLAPQPLPLHLRPRQNGDRFQPLGLGGRTKKVKDYMIDEKIPVWLRDRIYLLVNNDDEIMAIPGYCVSEKFKVKPEDEMVLRIEKR